MGYTLVLAEKPSVAATLAQVLKANKRNDGYFEGNGYIVTFAFGHLFELYDAKDYDESMSNWELDKFPFFPKEYKYKIKTDKKTKETDKRAEKQFNIIKKLANRDDVTQIITATDWDREGEVIAMLIWKHIGINKPHKRILVNEWTYEDIKKGMKNLKDISEMKSLQEAGEARTIIDWALGANFTAAATCKFVKGKCR